MQWKNNTPLFLSAFFAVVFCSVSFTNYYVFRSAALDLGLYTNAIFDYAHLRFNDSSTFKIIPENLLSDHFDLMLMLISPLSYLFRNHTLLVIQNAALIFGGYGVFRYLQSREMNQNFCLAGMAIFYLQFSVFAAVGADYHSKVVAVSLLPWFFYYLHSKKFYASTLIFILIIICQENMSLWMTFVAAGAILIFKTGIQRKILSVYIVISILYFFVITVYVMPSMSVSHSFYQFRYSILGTNYPDAINTILSSPLKIARALFVNSSNDHMGNYVKSECWLFFICSGGLLLLFKPAWLLMLIPVFLQKFLHDQVQMWGVNDQYTIEFSVVIALGTMDVISGISMNKIKWLVTILVLAGALSTTIRLMDRTSALLPKSKIRIYQPGHWKSEIDQRAAYEAIQLVPKNVSVSAHTNLLPHLAYRNHCYTFPNIGNAEYIIYVKNGNPYPFSSIDYNRITDSISLSKEWNNIYYNNGIILLKRK